MIVTYREIEREREAETQAEGEAGSMQEPDMGSRPEAKAVTQPLSHLGVPSVSFKRDFVA